MQSASRKTRARDRLQDCRIHSEAGRDTPSETPIGPASPARTFLPLRKPFAPPVHAQTHWASVPRPRRRMVLVQRADLEAYGCSLGLWGLFQACKFHSRLEKDLRGTGRDERRGSRLRGRSKSGLHLLSAVLQARSPAGQPRRRTMVSGKR